MQKNCVTFDKKLNIISDLLIQETEDGETIFLNLKTECYLSLDNTGTVFWRELTNQARIQNAYDKLLESYNVNPDELKKDLIEFIEKLLDKDLVEIVDK